MKCIICNKILKNKTVFMYNDNSYCSNKHRNIDINKFDKKINKNDNYISINSLASYLIIKINA